MEVYSALHKVISPEVSGNLGKVWSSGEEGLLGGTVTDGYFCDWCVFLNHEVVRLEFCILFRGFVQTLKFEQNKPFSPLSYLRSMSGINIAAASARCCQF